MSNAAEQFRLRRRKSNGTWYIYTGAGANTRSISTRTKILAEAEVFRAQFIAGIENEPLPPTCLIGEILDRYKKDHGVETRSVKTIEHHLKVLKPFFGQLLSTHITNKMLKDYALKRRRDGVKRIDANGNAVAIRPVSDGTILREIGTLKAALHFAAGNRWIPMLPPLQSPVSQPAPRDIWLTKGDVARLIKNAKSEHIALFIQIAVSTAARSGAILDLTWDRVDINRGTIDFGRGWGNKHRSVVPINGELMGALKSAKDEALSDHVISYSGAGVKSIKCAFRRLAKASGITCSPHVLRHTAATWMVMAGIPLSEVARLLGDSEKTVERVYGKHSPDYLRRAVSALNLKSDSSCYQAVAEGTI